MGGEREQMISKWKYNSGEPFPSENTCRSVWSSHESGVRGGGVFLC